MEILGRLFRLLALCLGGLGLACDSGAQKPIRIACVGDSITEGTANPDHALHHWPRLLQGMLDEVAAGEYEVKNYGLSGTMLLRDAPVSYWKTGHLAASLRWKPDVVIVNLGTNDALRREVDLDAAQVQADLEALLEGYRQANPNVRLWLSDLTPIFPIHRGYAYSRPARELIAGVIRRVGEQQGLSVLGFHGALADQPRWLPDGLHPNTLANERLAQTVFEALRGSPAPQARGIRPAEVTGEPTALLRPGPDAPLEWGAWRRAGQVAQGHGLGQRIAALVSLGTGDFHLRARLRMRGQKHSAAGFFFDGNFLGFEGDRGTLFRRGPVMKTFRFLHPSPSLWERDAWIDFEWIRNGETAWFLVDGFVVECVSLPGMVETFGFDPGRSTMEIADWTIVANLLPREPSFVRQRSVDLPWVDWSQQSEHVAVLPEEPSAWGPNESTGRAVQWIASDEGAPSTHYRLREPGQDWGVRLPLPAALVGREHQLGRFANGKSFVVFIDGWPQSPTYQDLVLWVGDLFDPGIQARREGEFTARLVPQVGRSAGQRRWRLSPSAPDGEGGAPSVSAHGPSGWVRVGFPWQELVELVPARRVRLPLVDLDRDEDRFVTVDREKDQYLGHVTTTLLEDGKTLLAAYPKGHGRGPIVLKRSEDGGRTWSERLPTPDSWASSQEVPTIHSLVDPTSGQRRLILWSGLHPARLAHSEDEGATWSELQPAGDWGGIVVMGSVVPLQDGSHVAWFHDDGRFFGPKPQQQDPVVFTLYQTMSRDGGRTWNQPQAIWSGSERHLCEPGAIRSPDGQTLALLLRENSRRRNSYVIFSEDEARTWSAPRELPASLTGDRHTLAYAPDGRLFASFRDTALDSPTQGDWVGWVGTFEDLRQGTRGQYRVRFKDNLHRWDCAYPGVVVLPDGTFVVTTYGHWEAGEAPYILSARFTLDELDARVP